LYDEMQKGRAWKACQRGVDWEAADFNRDNLLLQPWVRLGAAQARGYRMARDEKDAYAHLSSLQGILTPKFHHFVCTQPWTQGPYSSGHDKTMVKSCGFIVEYIEGRTLKTLDEGGDYVEEEVYEDIMRSITAMDAFGFTHNSVHGRNIILRNDYSPGASSVVFVDLYRHSGQNREPCLCNADDTHWK
jgi:hypothetical protein